MISQVPPRYSALKVEGARAYDLARDEEDFELAPRTVVIDRLDLVAHPDPDHCVLEAECGKGTYVRAIARDLGRALQLPRPCGGVAADAGRCLPRGGRDHAGRGRSSRGEGPDALLALLQPVEIALHDLPALSLSSSDAARLRQGQAVLLRGRDAPILSGPVYAISKGALVALGEVAQGEFRPRRIFNLPG